MGDVPLSTSIALVVEDDGQIAYLIQHILRREGYEVRVASDGLEAKQLIDELAPPAIVTLDFMLPHATGLELLAVMRAKPEWSDVPIVMLTARSQEKDIASAKAAGATDYLIKPFKPDDLRACIRRLAAGRTG
jgi:two-component system, OmpR family, alkaline phosphatase synthesis response regulator PhoP